MDYKIELLDLYEYKSPEDFDGEIDVKIIFDKGAEYMVTFITLEEFSRRLKIRIDYRSHNFSLGSNDLVVCETLSRQAIGDMIADIIKSEFYWTIFIPCNEKAEREVSEKAEPRSDEEAVAWFDEMENMINKNSE